MSFCPHKEEGNNMLSRCLTARKKKELEEKIFIKYSITKISHKNSVLLSLNYVILIIQIYHLLLIIPYVNAKRKIKT